VVCIKAHTVQKDSYKATGSKERGQKKQKEKCEARKKKSLNNGVSRMDQKGPTGYSKSEKVVHLKGKKGEKRRSLEKHDIINSKKGFEGEKE